MSIRALGTIHSAGHLGVYFGPGEIVGTAKNVALPDNVPVFRRLRLHEQVSGNVVREAWSDPSTGAYKFASLRITRYYVVGFDHTGAYGGVIETDLVPEVPA